MRRRPWMNLVYSMSVKRVFDFFVSGIFLVILCPVFLITGFFIKINSSGPVFFKQKRIGLKSKEFYIWKFRTMVKDAESKGLQLTVGGRDPRVTSVGYILRQLKLDELPQLINVFLGEMSLVGPRPEAPKYVKLYNQVQKTFVQV